MRQTPNQRENATEEKTQHNGYRTRVACSVVAKSFRCEWVNKYIYTQTSMCLLERGRTIQFAICIWISIIIYSIRQTKCDVKCVGISDAEQLIEKNWEQHFQTTDRMNLKLACPGLLSWTLQTAMGSLRHSGTLIRLLEIWMQSTSDATYSCTLISLIRVCIRCRAPWRKASAQLFPYC